MIHFQFVVYLVVRVGIAVLRLFTPMRFDEKSVQKLSGLAIIEVRSFHIPDQNKLRIGLIHACVQSVDLCLIDEVIVLPESLVPPIHPRGP